MFRCLMNEARSKTLRYMPFVIFINNAAEIFRNEFHIWLHIITSTICHSCSLFEFSNITENTCRIFHTIYGTRNNLEYSRHVPEHPLVIWVYIRRTPKVMFWSLFLCSSVCLFVCLQATLRKNGSMDSHKTFMIGRTWPKNYLQDLGNVRFNLLGTELFFDLFFCLFVFFV